MAALQRLRRSIKKDVCKLDDVTVYVCVWLQQFRNLSAVSAMKASGVLLCNILAHVEAATACLHATKQLLTCYKETTLESAYLSYNLGQLCVFRGQC